MPSFQDSIFLFVLALLLFGPKRLPSLAREVGKWLAEFRRASNEFKMQMEDELRAAEHAEQQKKIAAMEAAAPPPAALPAGDPEPAVSDTLASTTDEQMLPHPSVAVNPDGDDLSSSESLPQPPVAYEAPPAPEPLPIAEAGDLRMMPPATGLPRARSHSIADENTEMHDGLGGLIDAIPETTDPETQEAAHGR